jgi:Sulfotransferase domain
VGALFDRESRVSRHTGELREHRAADSGHFQPIDLALKRTPRPRIIKSHEYFEARYPKVIYIVRDPRDIALSYYSFSRKYRHIDDSCSLEKYVSIFVRSIPWSTWGTWGENVGSWVVPRWKHPNFLLVRYEDSKHTTGEMGKIARFMGIDASAERLAAAVEASSAGRMRELEKSQSQHWVATKGKRDDIPFVRTAKTGSWKTELVPASIVEIEQAWGGLMMALGYELAVVSPASVAGRLLGRMTLGQGWNPTRAGTAEVAER